MATGGKLNSNKEDIMKIEDEHTGSGLYARL